MTPFVRPLDGRARRLMSLGKRIQAWGGLRSGYGQGESVSTDTATRLMRSGARRSSPWTGPTGRPASRKWNEPKIPDYAKREGAISIV